MRVRDVRGVKADEIGGTDRSYTKSRRLKSLYVPITEDPQLGEQIDCMQGAVQARGWFNAVCQS
jgi:hypothetical protein